MVEDRSEPEAPEEKKIFVDEDWKEQARREKEELARRTEREYRRSRRSSSLPPPSFESLVSLFAIQATICLGEVENPVTGQKEVQLDPARHFIDTLQLLEEKTKGNLTEDEQRMLRALLFELRMKFVAATSGGAASAAGSPITTPASGAGSPIITPGGPTG